MNKRYMSLLATVVAFGGFALAIWIPAASAQKSAAASDSYTQYCEYQEYSQYCEPTGTGTGTTGTTGTRTTITQPSTTTTTPPPPTVVVGPHGTVFINLSQLEPGQTVVAYGVSVTLDSVNANGTSTVTFDGVQLVIPTNSTVVISKHHVVDVTWTVTKKAKSGHRVTEKVVKVVTTDQDISLPKGQTVQSFRLTLPSGVSFGAKASAASIAKFFGARTIGVKKSAALKMKVSANKTRTSVTISLSKKVRSFNLSLNTSQLVFSKAEKAYLKKHPQVTSLVVKNFTVTPSKVKGKTQASSTFPYAIPLS